VRSRLLERDFWKVQRRGAGQKTYGLEKWKKGKRKGFSKIWGRLQGSWGPRGSGQLSWRGQKGRGFNGGKLVDTKRSCVFGIH